MQLGYYFWDNFKKAWYTQWKLVRSLYKKQVIEWKKWVDVFVEEQTESVMKTERAKTDAQIKIFEQEIENSKNNIKNIENCKSDEKRKVKNSYSEKVEKLTNEKKRVESCFATYTTWLVEKAKSTEDLFSKLTKKLWEYAEETKEYMWKQSTKAKGSLDVILDNTKGFLLDDIKRDFLAYKAQNEEKNKSSGKNWLYLIILLLLCTFDVFAWYQAIDDLNPGMFWLIKRWLALLFVGMWIILIYFSWDEMINEWWSKQKALVCKSLVVVIFFWYIWLSLTDTTKNIIKWWNLNEIFSAILSDENLLMFLLRLLIIPALFVWDVIIKKIDSEAILWSLHFGNWLSKFFNRWLFFIKKLSFTKHVEEEKKQYWEILEWLKDSPIPWSEEVLFQIEKLESKIMPISNELITKRNECESKINDIDQKIKDILNEEAIKLDNIDESYVAAKANEELIIAKNTAMINALNEQLWKAEIAVREWVGLWLIA